jgi:SAM-dependent methyltransferase
MSTTSDSYLQPRARLHHSRVTAHEGSWHPDLAQTISSYISDLPSNGRILNLACSNGLSNVALAGQFHDASIIGVENTPGLLNATRSKHFSTTDKDTRVESYEHDILDLDSLAAVQNSAFDIIVCVLAFTLLPDPYKALAHWYRYLAPGGFVVLRVTHPQSLVAGLVFNRMATKLGVSVPYHHTWSQSRESLRDVFDKTDLDVLSIKFENQQDEVRMSHGTEHGLADAFFDTQMKLPIGDAFRTEAERSPHFLQNAREVFRAEWVSQGSKVQSEEVGGVWVGVARKLSSAAPKVPVNPPKLVGGCRCSAVRYEAYRRPTNVVVCHCFTCGRLSGSGNLPFVAVPTNSFRYVKSRGLKTLRLSDVASRTFCTECGSPLGIVFDGTKGYENEKGKTNIVLGSVDMDSLGGEAPEVWGHIFVGEKCIWETLPDDGAQRLREFTSDAE